VISDYWIMMLRFAGDVKLLWQAVVEKGKRQRKPSRAIRINAKSPVARQKMDQNAGNNVEI
jgi:hypothetical protein